MYGVPADLKLEFLHGAELVQLCLGQYQIQLHFHPIGVISVEGAWKLLGAGGECLDWRREDGASRPPYQLHLLLCRHVVESVVSPPEWFALKFEGGFELQVFDDSTSYESFQIQPGGIVV